MLKGEFIKKGKIEKRDRERKKNEKMKVGKKERTKARNWDICKERKFARMKLSKKSNKQKKEGNQQRITPGFKCLNKKSLFIFIFRFILISCALSWCSLIISHSTYLSAKLFHYL